MLPGHRQKNGQNVKRDMYNKKGVIKMTQELLTNVKRDMYNKAYITRVQIKEK
jgi:hypothetical protein